MNSAHDLGGMHGFGAINPEPENEEPVFHTDWEKRVFGLALAAGFLGKWNIDMSRYARERQHPIDYLRHTYYENWLAGLKKLLVEAQLVNSEELKTGQAAGPADESIRQRVLKAGEVDAAIVFTVDAQAGSSSGRPPPGSAINSVGGRVSVGAPWSPSPSSSRASGSTSARSSVSGSPDEAPTAATPRPARSRPRPARRGWS